MLSLGFSAPKKDWCGQIGTLNTFAARIITASLNFLLRFISISTNNHLAQSPAPRGLRERPKFATSYNLPRIL